MNGFPVLRVFHYVLHEMPQVGVPGLGFLGWENQLYMNDSSLLPDQSHVTLGLESDIYHPCENLFVLANQL